MLKKFTLAAAAVAATTALAPHASAATFYLTLSATNPYSASFAGMPAASGNDIYYFALPAGMTSGTVAGATITVDFGTTIINSVNINGTFLDVEKTALGYSALGTVSPRNAPYQYINVKYTVPAGVVGAYSGVVSFTPGAVPESATWAMMISGFGLVGGAMRTRKIKASFA